MLAAFSEKISEDVSRFLSYPYLVYKSELTLICRWFEVHFRPDRKETPLKTRLRNTRPSPSSPLTPSPTMIRPSLLRRPLARLPTPTRFLSTTPARSYRPTPSLKAVAAPAVGSYDEGNNTLNSPSDLARRISAKVLPKIERPDVKRVLVVGSGGLSIGQAGEFDYSGQSKRAFSFPFPRSLPFPSSRLSLLLLPPFLLEKNFTF